MTTSFSVRSIGLVAAVFGAFVLGGCGENVDTRADARARVVQSQRSAEAQYERDICGGHPCPKEQMPLYHRLFHKHANARIAEAEKFIEVPIGGGDSWNPDSFEQLNWRASNEAAVLSMAASFEYNSLPPDQRSHEAIAAKYIAKFDEWFNPKWEKVKKAGPGRASWHLRFEIDPDPKPIPPYKAKK